MKFAIIGAGFGGLTAAYDLIRAGHTVRIYEASAYPGGLSAGLKQPGWDWSVEQFYHHWFASDSAMLGLLRELGLEQNVIFNVPKTVAYYKEKFYPLDSPIAALTFPGFQFFDMMRFGLVTFYLKYLAQWQPLEKYTAAGWIKKAYGDRLYKFLFEPLLIGKFGRYYQDVNMAWFWARFKARTTRLGTYRGGFQAFADTFTQKLQEMGADFHFSTPVENIASSTDGTIKITCSGSEEIFDGCLATVSPALFARLAPTLEKEYLQGLLELKSMGSVMFILALKHQLSREGYYWYNIPKSAGFPFLALVEHTNFVSSEYFGGEHIVYIGDYLEADHAYFRMSKEELAQLFLPALKRINPDFSPDWVRETWLFRTNYAQPVPLVNHSKNIPAIRTPMHGLYFASMSQVYPWDRGTNFAVKIAREAVRMMLDDLR